MYSELYIGLESSWMSIYVDLVYVSTGSGSITAGRLDEEAVRGRHGVEVGHLAARAEAVLRVAL